MVGVEATASAAAAEVTAAGTVTTRRRHGRVEVLLVHRPGRGWSLPKGKTRPGERRRSAAARETLEETGRSVAVGARVADVTYRDRHGRSKQVRFYRAAARANRGFTPSAEVDRASWVPVAAAVRKVPARDRRVLEAAAA